MKTDKITIEIIQPKLAKNRIQSFWYNGDVAIIKKRDRKVVIEGCGSIRVRFDEEDDCTYRDDQATEEALSRGLTDKDLKHLVWTDNNWFDFYLGYNITEKSYKKDLANLEKWRNRLADWLRYKKSFEDYKKDNEWLQNSTLDDVTFEYDEATEIAKELLNDEYVWAE